MIYNFKFDVLQGGIGISEGFVSLDLTETEMLFVYAAYKTKDPMFSAKALKSVEKKADIAIKKMLEGTPSNGPKLIGAIRLNEEIPLELYDDASSNPLSDALIKFIGNAEQIESLVFYDGVREYCDKIIKAIR